MLRLKDEQLALEKGNLSNEFMSQIAAVHQVERATARVSVGERRAGCTQMALLSVGP
jgi:hypothetical protein